jgi:hypothetical protein
LAFARYAATAPLTAMYVLRNSFLNSVIIVVLSAFFGALLWKGRIVISTRGVGPLPRRA